MQRPLRFLACSALFLGVSASTPTLFAHEACAGPDDCADGEVCFEDECSVACSTDDDCPEEQTCAEATACQHTDEAAHQDEGCSASGTPGASSPWSLFGLALLTAIPVAASRRRRK